MATYAVGDLHGNLAALERLLDKLSFNPDCDRLWFVGDIVNRGPDSLGCLRFVRSLGDSAVTILGNHDLALLVRAQQPDTLSHFNPSLAPILKATECDSLLDWLRHRPLIHHDSVLGWTMVHAGIPAVWGIGEAQRHACELAQALRGPNHADLLANLYGDTPAIWCESLTGHARMRFITNALTRQRFVHPHGQLDLAYKTTLEETPEPLTPWFTLPNRQSAQQRIVFGHWSALSPVAWPQYNVWCIDTGAAWGGHLTAIRLDGHPRIISVAAQ